MPFGIHTWRCVFWPFISDYFMEDLSRASFVQHTSHSQEKNLGLGDRLNIRMALEILLSSPFFYVAVIFAAYFIFSKLTAPSTLPPDVPWIELPEGRFAKTRMRFASLTQGPRLLELMNEKVRKPLWLKISVTDCSCAMNSTPTKD
jgi:hypothetical protein